MSVTASLSTPATLYVLKNIFHFTWSLFLQEHCTSWTRHNITSSLLMEAIHHVGVQGLYTRCVLHGHAPRSNTLPPICPRPSTSVILHLAGWQLSLLIQLHNVTSVIVLLKGNSAKIGVLIMFLFMIQDRSICFVNTHYTGSQWQMLQILCQITCADSRCKNSDSVSYLQNQGK